jgi:glucose-1-phosphatase
MIRTIIFDLGKVIVPFDFQRSYNRLAPLCGLRFDEIPERLRPTGIVQRFESGQIEPEAFVQEFSRLLGIDLKYSEFCDIWSAIFLPETLIPDAMLEALHRNYRLLLLSNTNAIHFEMIEANYPILRHFDHKVLSYKVGAMKPDPKIYAEAIRHAHCEPHGIFFTDDIPEYVEGARQAGIDAVQFQNAEQIVRELRARGVEW